MKYIRSLISIFNINSFPIMYLRSLESNEDRVISAHVTGPGAGGGPIKDESMATGDGGRGAGDISAEIAEHE